MTYSVLAYCGMIGDQVRAEAYAAALERTVREGSVVVEIGTGTGVFALLAARLGAARVYAIEIDAAVGLGRELAAANGLGDRVRFLHGRSREIELPERADLLFSDLRGVLPLLGEHLPDLADARARYLKPGGRVLPLRDELFAGVVEAEDLYRELVEQWAENHFGFDVGPLRRVLVNTLHKSRSDGVRLLAEPACWATIDYATVEDPGVAGALRLVVREAGLAHGLHLWFDTELVEGVGLSNAPGRPRLVYGSHFAPFERPLALTPGDVVEVRLAAHLVASDYVWRWETRVLEGGDEARAGPRLSQSTFHGAPLASDELAKRAEAYAPVLSERGKIDGLVLARMGEGRPLGEIATELVERFPRTFPTWPQALVRVGDLSVRYT